MAAAGSSRERHARSSQRLELDEALVSVAGILSEQDYPEFTDQASINEWVRAQRQTEEAS